MGQPRDTQLSRWKMLSSARRASDSVDIPVNMWARGIRGRRDRAVHSEVGKLRRKEE